MSERPSTRSGVLRSYPSSDNTISLKRAKAVGNRVCCVVKQETLCTILTSINSCTDALKVWTWTRKSKVQHTQNLPLIVCLVQTQHETHFKTNLAHLHNSINTCPDLHAIQTRSQNIKYPVKKVITR